MKCKVAGKEVATQTKASVMVTRGAFKSNTMATDQPLVFPLCLLKGLTADCIFMGMQKNKVFFGMALPNLPLATNPRWIIIIFIVDDASSNRRVIAHIRAVLIAGRPRVLVLHIRCLAHLCHRAATPVIEHLKLGGPLYRAANVMCLSSYWLSLCRSLEQHVRGHIQVLHHCEADPLHEQIARDILRLTLSINQATPPSYMTINHQLPTVVQ